MSGISNNMIKYLKSLQNYLKLANLPEDEKAVLDLSERVIPSSDWDEAAREFGSLPKDEYLYLKEIIPEYNDETLDFNENYKYICNHNSLPIISVLGMGATGMVIETIYNSKPAVAKLILDQKVANDVQVWNKILLNKDKLPTKFQKFIPEIYKLIKNILPEGQPYQIIITEKLYPLPYDILQNIFNYIYSYTNRLYLLTDEELYELAKVLFAKLQDHYLSKKIDFTPIEIYNILVKNLSNKDAESQGEAQKISTDIEKLFKNITTQDKNNVISYIWSSILDLFLFPRSYGSYKPSPFLSSSPLIKDLLEFLIYLADNFSIYWHDVHKNNIMMNKDGQIKIIDTGFYRLQNPEI